MTVTETLMSNGSWGLKLRETTPGNILWQARSAALTRGLLKVFPGRVPHGAIAATDTPLYTGVFGPSPDPFTYNGFHASWFLGQDGNPHTSFDDQGPFVIESAGGNLDFTEWVDALFACGIPFTRGDIRTGGLDHIDGPIFEWITPRNLLDGFICPLFDVGWRVNQDLSLDINHDIKAGGGHLNAASIKAGVVLVPGGGGYCDTDAFYAIDIDQPTIDINLEDTTLRTIQQLGAVGGTRSYHDSGVVDGWVRAPNGQQLAMTKMTSGATSAAGVASPTYSDTTSMTGSQVRVSTKDFAVTRKLTPGDHVLLLGIEPSDPMPHTSFGQTLGQPVQLQFRGQLLAGLRIQVTSVDWQLEAGMGVYLDNRHNAHLPSGAASVPGISGDVIDLTDFVEWEG